MTLEELNASNEMYICEICKRYEATIHYDENNMFVCKMCDKEPFWDFDLLAEKLYQNERK